MAVEPIEETTDTVMETLGDDNSEIVESVVEDIVDVDEVIETASDIVDGDEALATVSELDSPTTDTEISADVPDEVEAVAESAYQNGASASTEAVDSYIAESQTDLETSMQAEAPMPNVTPAQSTAEQTIDAYKEHIDTGPDTSDPALNPNFLEPSGIWPPPIFLDTKTASQQQRYYVEHRWYSQWSFYDKKASDAKLKYQRLQMGIGVGSVIVPVLVGYNTTNSDINGVIQVATVIISLMVAAAAAIENVKKYGDAWRNYRSAAEELAREKSLYDMNAGPYREAQKPFLLFTERCEDVIAKQNGAFFTLSQEGTKDKDGDGVPDEDTSGGELG